jgi:steroid Delta-isomerase
VQKSPVGTKFREEAHPQVVAIVHFFEHLAPADLQRMGTFYTPDARFKDPFNAVQGVQAIADIFGHMFRNLDGPRFVVLEAVHQDDRLFLSWDFLFRMQRWRTGEQRIHGGSLLRLAADGRIEEHRDYWDAAEELYEKLPAIGALMRWLKRRAAG